MHVLPEQWVAVLTGSGPKPEGNSTGVPAAAGHKATSFDAVALGFNIVIVGVYYGWNTALTQPYGVFWACYVVIALGFVSLAFSLAELSSFFPFGGGTFGYARCIISPSLGFIVGMAELLEYLLFVVSGVGSLGGFCTSVFRTSPDVEPVWWVVFFVLSLVTQIPGGSVLWMTMRAIFVVTAAVCALYFFSMLRGADGAEYSPVDVPPGTHGGMRGFMEIFPAISWMFFCMEAMVLTAEDVQQPNKAIPRATLTCCAVLLVVMTLCVIVSTCSFPGSTALAGEVTVFTPGLMHVLKWSPEAALALTIPATFASPYGLLYAAAKLMASMASSKVLPAFVGKTYGRNGTPVAALFVCSAICFGLLYILRNVDPEYMLIMLQTCLLNASFVYVVVAVCFYICKERYSNLVRHFTSPLGMAGAVIMAAAFALVFIALAFFSVDYRALEGYVIYTAACVAIYFAVVRRYEFFSDAEVNTFMKAYVINANLRRKQEIKRKSKQRMASLHSSARSNRSNQSGSSKKAAVAPTPTSIAALGHTVHASGSANEASQRGHTSVRVGPVPGSDAAFLNAMGIVPN